MLRFVGSLASLVLFRYTEGFQEDHVFDDVLLLQQSLSHDDPSGINADQSSDRLQRNVFLFWNQGWSPDVVPEYVLANALSWKVQNPTWKVHMLDGRNETLAQYFDQHVLDMLWIQESMQFKSDLLRTYALATHGGVYADADVLCAKPLDDYIDKKMKADFYAYRQIEQPPEMGPRYLSSWFLAAKRGGYIISHMAEALVPLASQSGVEFSSVHFMETYYRWHYTFSVLILRDTYFKELWDKAPHCHWVDYSCFDANCSHVPCVHKYKVDPNVGFAEFKDDVDQECANVYKTDYSSTPKAWVDYATSHTLAKM